MHYKNKQRTFITDFSEKDERGYVKVKDKESKVEFFLPEFTIRAMDYQFSWNRYKEDLDKEILKKALELEIKRIESLSFSNPNTKIGLEQLEIFLEGLF